jgi:hypothetical protein
VIVIEGDTELVVLDTTVAIEHAEVAAKRLREAALENAVRAPTRSRCETASSGCFPGYRPAPTPS